MKVSRKTVNTTAFGIEELAAEVCDEFMVSGEVFYTLVECFAAAKLAELNGELVSD